LSADHPRLWTRQLDWMDALDDNRSLILNTFLETLAPDVIIGADVVSISRLNINNIITLKRIFQLYHPDIVPALLATIVAALKLRPSSTAAYLALTLRNPDLFHLFLSATGMHTYYCPRNGNNIVLQISMVFPSLRSL
jgi:hypothetical protein